MFLLLKMSQRINDKRGRLFCPSFKTAQAKPKLGLNPNSIFVIINSQSLAVGGYKINANQHVDLKQERGIEQNRSLLKSNERGTRHGYLNPLRLRYEMYFLMLLKVQKLQCIISEDMIFFQ